MIECHNLSLKHGHTVTICMHRENVDGCIANCEPSEGLGGELGACDDRHAHASVNVPGAPFVKI